MPKAKKKKIIKEDAKAKKRAKAAAKVEAKKRKKNDPNKVKIDQTFGLKNKKGSKNRRFVKNAMNNMNQEEIQKKREREQKKREKQMLRRMKEEEDALFKTVDSLPQFKKKQQKKQNEEEEEKKVEVDDETLLNNCDPDELDKLIDRLRVKFDNQTDLTPVNEKTFNEWLERKEREKEAEKEAKAKRKLKKKGKKKGLTGKELFLLTPTVFKDDEDAAEDIIFEKDEQSKLNNSDNNNNDNNTNNSDIAAVNDVCDASLFLEMDDMLNEMEIID